MQERYCEKKLKHLKIPMYKKNETIKTNASTVSVAHQRTMVEADANYSQKAVVKHEINLCFLKKLTNKL